MRPDLAFVSSGEGEIVRSVINAIEQGHLSTSVAVVLSDNPHAGVLKFARTKRIPSFYVADTELLEVLQSYAPTLIILAEYYKKIRQPILRAFRNRILNIHPSLLPCYAGKGMYGDNVHKAVLASDDQETGATIHLVTEHYDKGRIIAQRSVPRYPDDSVQTLSARVSRCGQSLCVEVLQDIEKHIPNLDQE